MASDNDKLTTLRNRARERAEETELLRSEGLGGEEDSLVKQQLGAANKMIAAQNKRIEALEEEKRERKPNKWKMAGVDFGSSFGAQSLNEGINWLVRWRADANKSGFTALNNDFLQSVPQVVFGAIWYALEMYKVKGEWPKGWKAARLQAANLLMNLGLSNLARVVRSRLFESRENSLAMQAALRESLAKGAEMQRELAEIKGRFDALSRTRGQ